MFVSHFFAGESFIVVVIDRFFFIWETQKAVAGRIRQVVVLYSNDLLGQTQHWLSYRRGHLNRFDCIPIQWW